MIQKLITRLSSKKLPVILQVQTAALRAISDYMRMHSIPQIMPIMLSPITDPLNHSVFDAEIKYYKQRLQLTKSITVHKPLILMGNLSAFYCLSPNIRLEKAEKASSGRHLIEFSQCEMEFKDIDKWQFMGFLEGLVKFIVMRVMDECSEELEQLGRVLSFPKGKFEVFESKELEGSFDEVLSKKAKSPFWVLDFKREFYDREDEKRRGYYHNYDLIWPEGFGEALSGGEREYEYDKVVRKMRERGMDLEPYKTYLRILKAGKVPRTAGGGLGIERLVRYLTGVKDIDEVTLFPRKAGAKILL